MQYISSLLGYPSCNPKQETSNIVLDVDTHTTQNLESLPDIRPNPIIKKQEREQISVLDSDRDIILREIFYKLEQKPGKTIRDKFTDYMGVLGLGTINKFDELNRYLISQAYSISKTQREPIPNITKLFDDLIKSSQYSNYISTLEARIDRSIGLNTKYNPFNVTTDFYSELSTTELVKLVYDLNLIPEGFNMYLYYVKYLVAIGYEYYTHNTQSNF